MRNHIVQLQLYLRAKEYAYKIFKRVPNCTLENARKIFTTDLYRVVVNEYQLYCKINDEDKASKALRNALIVTGININEYGRELKKLRSTYLELDSLAKEVLLKNNVVYKKLIPSLPSKKGENLFRIIELNNKTLRDYGKFSEQRDIVLNKATINLYSQSITDIKFALATCNEWVDKTHIEILKINNTISKQKGIIELLAGGFNNEQKN